MDSANKFIDDNVSDRLLDMLQNIEIVIRLMPEKVNLVISKNTNINKN